MEREARTEKQKLARDSLPKEMRAAFDDFVADWRFAAIKHHGAAYVSYAVIAEMVRAGWRLTEKAKPSKKIRLKAKLGHYPAKQTIDSSARTLANFSMKQPPSREN
ncbi:MAG: hypothetical protein EXS05_23985 [Planctomycetaceae bacterium]|nr:hypothetical protein [Planctomycetaceae bacterium]